MKNGMKRYFEAQKNLKSMHCFFILCISQKFLEDPLICKNFKKILVSKSAYIPIPPFHELSEVPSFTVVSLSLSIHIYTDIDIEK